MINKIPTLWVLVSGALVLGACDTSKPTAQPLTAVGMKEVILAIKREIGDYQASVFQYVSQPEGDPAKDLVSNAELCAGGKLLVAITKVHIEMTSTLSNTKAGSLALTIPIGATGAAISPSLSTSFGNSSTQELVFDEVPEPEMTLDTVAFSLGTEPPAWLGTRQKEHGQLWSALMGFREALLAGAGEYPCFKSPPPKEKADAGSGGNTFKLAFTATRNNDQSVGIKLAVLASASVSNSDKSTTGNTLGVTFKILSSKGNVFMKPAARAL